MQDFGMLTGLVAVLLAVAGIQFAGMILCALDRLVLMLAWAWMA